MEATSRATLVTIDDHPIGSAPIGALVNPGRHSVVLTAEGQDPLRLELDLKEGEHYRASHHPRQYIARVRRVPLSEVCSSVVRR